MGQSQELCAKSYTWIGGWIAICPLGVFRVVSSGKKSLVRRCAQVFLIGCLFSLGVTISFAQAPASGAAPISASDETQFEKATAALNGGDFARAESLLKELHLRHPHNYEINESLGLAYASQNQLDSALPLLKAAAQEQPIADVAHANLGAAYLKLGRNSDAARELQTAAQLDPGNAQTQEALGQTWMLLQEPRKASAAFSAALAKDGANPDLLYNGALAFYETGDTAKADSWLSRMPGVETSAEAQSLYGDVEEKLGHYKDSAQHYVNAVKLAPTEANVYVLGVDFLRHWTFEPAVKEFEAGVKEFPDSRRMRFGLGVAYYGNGNYDQAIPVFAALLDTDAENTTYAELLGRTCMVLTEGTDPRCQAVLGFAEKHPQNAMLGTYAATNILHRPSDPGQLEQARRLLQAAIQANPSLPEARYEMAVLLQTQKEWQQSIPELEAAIRSKPDYSQAHYRLALAYSHAGRKEEANSEIALQQKYSQQENQDLDARMKQITTLLVSMK